jgi:ribose transport system substrate-binding protein
LTTTKNFTRLVLTALLAVTALLLSACSTETPTAAVADSSATAAAAEKAQADVEPFLKAAVQENPWKGPDSAPAAKAGVRVTIISQMNATGAALPANAMAEAATVLGWVPTIVDNQGRPDLKLAAINAAVDDKVDAIILVFVDPSLVASAITRAQDAGITLLTFGIPKDTGFGIPDVHPDYAVQGKALAQYLIAASGAKLNLLLEEASDEFAITDGHDPAVRDYIEDDANCPGCTVKTNQYVLSNFVDPTSGPAAQATASLQTDPSLNWVTCFDACLFQVISAVERAGLDTRVSAAGFNCTPENLAFILEARVEKACVADSMELGGWAAIDNVNRLLNGAEPFDYTTAYPVAVFDQAALQSLSPERQAELLQHGWDGNVDFRAEFTTIWGLD